ncbi:uncharacterized protein LOC119580258 [Penaeus monodon]|uniref:uncharacterized protein LOC119580258 n=1 Tax=Penaeus monodon TaxID=6687 RepID=UPI0018A73758|nr:uncharacterized protein LOC119580258 [Penaeus monodon]
MSPLQWPTPTFASLAFLLLSLGSFSDSTSSRGHTASLLPRENVRGIHGEDDISFAGRNIQNEDEGSVESETETKVLDSREERKRPYIPLNSLTFMTANSHVSTIDWSSTDPSQIRQYIAGSKLAGIPQTSTIGPASQKLTTSTLPPFPLIHKTTTKRSTPLTKNPFLLTTRRPAFPTVVRNVSTTSSVLLNSRPITTFRTPTTPTTIRPTASAIVSSTASGMHTSSTTRRLTAITGRPVELTTGSIKSTTSPLITWKPSSLAIRNTSAVTATSSIITWRPSSLANSNTYAITAEGTSDKPMTSATELTTIGSTFFTQWFTNNGNSLTTGFSPTTEKIPPPPTELPPPLDSIKPPLLSTWRPTLRPIPNYVKVTTQPPTTQSMSSSTTTDLPVNKLNPNASTEHSPVLSLDNNYTTSSPAVQESHSPISGMSTALPIRNTPTPNCVNVTTEALTTQSTSTTTQVPVNQVNPSAATENSPFLSWNNNFYSTSSPVVQESYSPTVRTTTSSAPLLRITRWTSTISPQVVTSQPVQRPGNTGHMPAHQNKFNSDSMEGQGIKPIKHATPPSEQQNYETEHEPLSHWQYLDSSPQPVDSYTTRPQLVVTNNFISDDDQKLIHEAFNRFQTHFSSATDSSTTWQEDIQDTDVPQIPTIEEPGAIGLAPQPLWTTTQLLDDNKTSSVFHDDMVWHFDSSNEYNPNVSWITNPRPQVSHNFPFTSEVTRDPITTPDPALFEIISGSSNESPEKFPSNTDQSQFMTSKPTQIPTHNTSKQELFTISENGSHPTRASILRPLISPEVQVDTHAELFKVSQPDDVPGSSLAASLPTVDSNDDYDFDYAVYEDDLKSGSNLGQSDGVDQHHQSSGSHFAHPSNHNNQQNHHPSVQVKIWKMVDGQLRLVEEQSVPSGMFQNSGLTNGAVVNPQDVPSDVLSMVATRMEDPSLLYSLLNYNARKRRSLPSKPEGAVSAEADLGKTELKENKSETPLHHRSTISINSAHTLSNNQPNNNVEKKTNEYPAILEKMQENRRPTGNSSTFRIKEISSIPAISPDGKNKSITHFVKTSRMNDESAHSDTPVIHLVIPNLKEQPSFNTLLQRLATQSQQTLINRESQTNNREFFPRNETAAGLAFAHDQNNQRTPPARSHPISAFGGVGNNNLPFTPSPVTFQSVPSEALLPQATKPEVLTEIKHYGGVGNRNHTNLPLNIGTSLDENNLSYLHVLSRLANQIQSSNVQNPSLQGILGDITRNSPGVQASGVVGYSAAGTLLNSGASTQGNSFSQLLQEPSFPGEHRGSVLELLPSDLPHVNPLLPPDEPLDHPVPLSGVLGSLPSSSTLHREQLRKKLATITGTNTFSGHLGNEGFLNQNNHAVQNSVLGNQGQQSTFNQLTSDSQIRHPGALASLVKPGPIDTPNLTPSLPTNAFINTNSFFLPNLQNGQTALFNQQPISPGYPQSGNQDLRLPGGSLSYPQSGNQDLRLPGGSLSSPSQQMASPASNQQTIINRADVLSIIDRLQSQGSIPNGQSILDFSQTSAASILPLQQPADLSPFDPSLPYLPYQDAPNFSDSPLISSLPGGTLNPSPATVTSSNVQGCTQSTLCSLGLASLVALGISNALALPFITPLFVGRRRRRLDFTGNFTGQRESHIENDILRELVTMAVTANPGFRDILTAAMAFHVDKAQQGKNTEDHIILNAKAKEYKQLLMSLKNDQISFLIQHALNMISGRKQPQVDYNTPT